MHNWVNVSLKGVHGLLFADKTEESPERIFFRGFFLFAICRVLPVNDADCSVVDRSGFFSSVIKVLIAAQRYFALGDVEWKHRAMVSPVVSASSNAAMTSVPVHIAVSFIREDRSHVTAV